MLKILHNTTVISSKVENYIDENYVATMSAASFIYVGYKKPINALYLSLLYTVASEQAADNILVSYWNGSAFTTVLNLKDKTNAYARSGFLSWDRNSVNEAKTTIEGTELYWYKLGANAGTFSVTIYGINLLLSDDLMIKEVEPHLNSVDFYPEGFTSFIPFHQSARNEIIQRLRNEGKGTHNGTTFNDLTVFDLLDYTQLGEASKYLAIAQVYFNLSDSVDDKYWQKYEDYTKRYNNAYRVFFLSIDSNDDGIQSTSEKESFKSGIIIRV